MKTRKEELAFLESKLLTLNDVENLCEQFGIGRLKYVIKHFQDTANINILIDSDQGRYVMKFFHIDHDRFQNIINVIQILQKNHIPVVQPLKNINNEYLVNVKDYTVQLTPYIEARHFSYRSRQLESSGEILRKFHESLTDNVDVSEPCSSIYPSSSVIKLGIANIKKLNENISRQQISLIDRLYTEIIGKWEEASKGLPTTVIHGDWKLRNLLFSREGEVCFILDLDYIQRGEKLFDIAYALWNFLLDPYCQPIASYFIKGYGPLTEQEENIMAIAIARVSLFFICTAAFGETPIILVNSQLEKQMPFIEYVISEEGEKKIKELCKVHDKKRKLRY